jgi:hypothetical protein
VGGFLRGGKFLVVGAVGGGLGVARALTNGFGGMSRLGLDAITNVPPHLTSVQ